MSNFLRQLFSLKNIKPSKTDTTILNFEITDIIIIWLSGDLYDINKNISPKNRNKPTK
jgi:hypothetical protein